MDWPVGGELDQLARVVLIEVDHVVVGCHTLVALSRPGVMIKAEGHRAAEEAGDRYESCHDKQRNPEADPGPTAVWMATHFAQQ
jgi:hypothetical protein